MLDSKLQPIGESSSHVTDDGTMILKGKTRDPQLYAYSPISRNSWKCNLATIAFY